MTPVPSHHRLWHQQAYSYNTKVNYPSRRKLPLFEKRFTGWKGDGRVPFSNFVLARFAFSHFIYLCLSLSPFLSGSLARSLCTCLFLVNQCKPKANRKRKRIKKQRRFRCFLHWTYKEDTKIRSNTVVRRVDGEDVSELVAKRTGAVSSPSLTSVSLLWQYKVEPSF